MIFLTILLQDQAAAQQGGSQFGSIIMLVLIFVVFYFFLIRPQSKRQKEIKKFQDSLQAGKRVVTSGGIYGKIKEVKDDVVVLEIADNVRVKVNKSMLFEVAETEEKPAQKVKEEVKKVDDEVKPEVEEKPRRRASKKEEE